LVCDGYIYRYLWDDLAELLPVAHFHYRGHGRSGLPVDREQIDVVAHAADLNAVRDHLGDPEVVLACCGDVPTLETLAAAALLREHLPDLRVRVVNVVDLMRMQPDSEHPHGLPDREFDGLFTTDRPIVFAHHGYPWLIHRLAYRRTNHANLHVRDYKEEGTVTTPFDMVSRNDLDRFHLVMDVVDRVPSLGTRAAHIKQAMQAKLIQHREYVTEHGDDLPEIKNWKWTAT
jgi:xylulose-5-phosphate/fructose-6-phosphate phosphoketolase